MPTTTNASDLAQRVRRRLLSTVERNQALSVDVTSTWVKALATLPGSDRRGFRRAGTGRGMEAAAMYSLDVASDLIAAQRSYVRRLTDVLDPSTPA